MKYLPLLLLQVTAMSAWLLRVTLSICREAKREVETVDRFAVRLGYTLAKNLTLQLFYSFCIGFQVILKCVRNYLNLNTLLLAVFSQDPLVVPWTGLKTRGDKAFQSATPRLRNSLADSVESLKQIVKSFFCLIGSSTDILLFLLLLFFVNMVLIWY